MNENIFRISAAVILLSAITISVYFRIKADKEAGGKVSTKDENKPIFLALRLGGLLLWFSGFASLGLIYWMFESIGNGITPTVATRKEHKLSTSGPYRWIRHPLYTFGTLAFLSLGLIADSWFIVLLSALAFILLSLRTPSEEAHLIEKFGDEYREYMKQTGRFFPKFI